MVQRASAVYLAVYTPYLIAMLLFAPPADVAAWRAWVGAPFNAMLFWLFGMALLGHAWVGTRDILMDYVRPLWLRLILLVLVAGWLGGAGFWFTAILLDAV